jgi:Rho GDP-dissociation inhibitor
MAPQEEDLLPENTAGYKLSQPKQTLEEYQKMGKSHERSLHCWLHFLPGQ